MDNLEDKKRGDMNSAGDSDHLRPDPIIQARDDSNVSHKGVRPTEIVPGAEKPVERHLSKLLSPVSAADATVSPSQSVRTGGPKQAAPSAIELLLSILRFKWTIVAVLVLVVVPAIAAIWTQVIPQYSAKAEVRVRPMIRYLVYKTEDSGMIPLYESFLNTQVSIIRSLTVLQRVLDQQEVQDTQWYKNPQQSLVERLRGNPKPPMERLRDALSVRPRSRTEIIDVSFMDPSSKDAEIIVNAVLDQYIRYIKEMSDTDEEKLYSQLLDEYKILDNKIKGREDFIAKYLKELGTQNPMGLIDDRRFDLDMTQARLSELQHSIDLLESERKTLEDLRNKSIADDNGDLSDSVTAEMEKQRLYSQDAEWRKRDENMRALRHQIANSLLTSKHSDMVQMENNLKFMEESLRRREAQLDEQWRNRPNGAAGVPTTITGAGGPSYEEQLRSLEYQLARTKQEEELLQNMLEKQQAEFKELFMIAEAIEKENTALLHDREVFDAVRKRRDAKDMERKVPGSIEVLMRAFAPSQPQYDRRIVFTAMALIMGLGMGGGAAFLRASRNQTIYTPKDMPYPAQVPFLGHIPVIRTRKSPGRSLSNEIEQNKLLLMESVRVVRTTLLSRLNGRNSTTVLVTSAAAGTGKSSFTMMLGKSLAQVGKRVLVIDADFHKMSLTKQFGLADKSGFMESLCCSSKYKRHIFPTEISGLSIMPAGKLSGNGQVFEETANGAFKICIGQLRRHYNIILLDSPPILPVADAAILSNQVDGTIMVEREHISRRSNVINAIARLDSAGGRLLGTIFIGSGSHEEYGYDYYYSKTSKP